jgi:hypothetical protein
MAVWENARLLGIPECRDDIVRRACRMALGHPVGPVDEFLPHHTGENRDVVLQACDAALRAAIAALEHLHECKNIG